MDRWVDRVALVTGASVGIGAAVVKQLSVSPGLVETEFAARMNKDEAKAQALYNSIECLQADDIADAVIYALSAPARVQVHDILMRPTEQLS